MESAGAPERDREIERKKTYSKGMLFLCYDDLVECVRRSFHRVYFMRNWSRWTNKTTEFHSAFALRTVFLF